MRETFQYVVNADFTPRTFLQDNSELERDLETLNKEISERVYTHFPCILFKKPLVLTTKFNGILSSL